MALSKVSYETIFGDGTTISIVVDKGSDEDGLPIGVFSVAVPMVTSPSWRSPLTEIEFADLLDGLAVAAIRLQDQGDG